MHQKASRGASSLLGKGWKLALRLRVNPRMQELNDVSAGIGDSPTNEYGISNAASLAVQVRHGFGVQYPLGLDS